MAGTDRLQNTSHRDLIARLNRAREMDVHTLDREIIDRRIGLIMDGYHTVVIKAEMNGLYRARKNVGDRPFEKTSELWYPPSAMVRSRGRFNEPGASVFYASNRSTTAIHEVRADFDDVVTLLVIRTKAPSVQLDCAHIGLERSLAPEIGAPQKERMLRNNPRFQAILKHYQISNKWLAIDEFLSEMATTLFPLDQEQDKYKITMPSRGYFSRSRACKRSIIQVWLRGWLA